MKILRYLAVLHRWAMVVTCLCFHLALQAQKAPLKVKVVTRNYSQYQWAHEMSSCTGEHEDEDTSKLRCVEVVEYSYPFFQSRDTSFNRRINGAVQTTFDYSGPSEKQRKPTAPRCPEDKPGEELLSYQMTCHQGPFLSFTIYKDMEPSGFGNGFRHDALPFTFDLENRRELKLGDVIQEWGDTTVFRIFISQIRNVTPDLLEENGGTNNPGLGQFFSSLESPFALNPAGVTLYFPMSYGGKYTYEQITLKFKDYPHLFKDERLLKVK